MSFSATRCTSFARMKVVLIRPWMNSPAARFDSIAFLWLP
jgi:hypothetical protein